MYITYVLLLWSVDTPVPARGVGPYVHTIKEKRWLARGRFCKRELLEREREGDDKNFEKRFFYKNVFVLFCFKSIKVITITTTTKIKHIYIIIRL